MEASRHSYSCAWLRRSWPRSSGRSARVRPGTSPFRQTGLHAPILPAWQLTLFGSQPEEWIPLSAMSSGLSLCRRCFDINGMRIMESAHSFNRLTPYPPTSCWMRFVDAFFDSFFSPHPIAPSFFFFLLFSPLFLALFVERSGRKKVRLLDTITGRKCFDLTRAYIHIQTYPY